MVHWKCKLQCCAQLLCACSTQCLKKRANTFFVLCWSNEFISIKIGRHVLDETLNKTVKNVQLSTYMYCETYVYLYWQYVVNSWQLS